MEAETLTCPECGAENAPDAEACLACGGDLALAAGPLAKIPTPAILGVVVLVLLIVLGVLAKTLYEKSRPSSHTQAGNAALDAQDYAGAAKEFKAALSYDRKYEQAIVGLARCGVEGGDATLISSYAKDALTKLEKGPLKGRIRMAYAWYLLEQDNPQEANNQAIDALEDDPQVDGADALRGLAALRLQPPSEEDALLYLKQAVGKESKRAEVYASLAKLLLAREEFSEGARVAQLGVELSPEDGGLWQVLAAHKRGLKDLEGEGLALRKSLEADDKNAAVHSQLSRVLLQLDKVDEALIHAKQAAEIDPNDADAQLALGRILLVNGKPLMAREALEKAQRLRSDSWEIDYLLGKSQTLTNDAQRGVRSMIKALKGREQERPDLVEEIAELGVKAESRDAATFLKDQVGNSNSYTLHYLYAKSLMVGRAGKSKEPEIKTHLSRCLKIDPKRREAPLLLGNFYREIDKPELAIEAWDQGLAAHPEDDELLRAKGQAALDLKRWDEAIAAFQKLSEVRPNDRDAKNKLKAAQDGKFFSND